LRGIAIQAALYPVPIHARDLQPTGVGVSVRIDKSIGSYDAANDDDLGVHGNYSLDHATYEGGVHLCYPFGQLAIDGEVDYGMDRYLTKLPSSLLVPDVDYRYLGAGGHASVVVGETARLAMGGRYLHLLSAGSVSDQMSYGGGPASGLALDGSIQVRIGDVVHLRAAFEYRRIELGFDRSGQLSKLDDIAAVTDSSFAGSAQLGVSF